MIKRYPVQVIRPEQLAWLEFNRPGPVRPLWQRRIGFTAERVVFLPAGVFLSESTFFPPGKARTPFAEAMATISHGHAYSDPITLHALCPPKSDLIEKWHEWALKSPLIRPGEQAV